MAAFSLLKTESNNLNYLIWNGTGTGAGLYLNGNFVNNKVGVYDGTSKEAFTAGEGRQLTYYNYSGTTPGGNYEISQNDNPNTNLSAGKVVNGDTLGRSFSPQTLSINSIFQELVFYPTDNSANKTGVQNNLESYYSIFYDLDAVAWFNAGQVTNITEKNAVNQYYITQKANNLYYKFYYEWICSTTSLAASLNDLKLDYNLTASSAAWNQLEIKTNVLSASFIPSNDGGLQDSYGFYIRISTAQANDRTITGARTSLYNAMHYAGGVRYTGNNSTFAGQTDDNWPVGTLHVMRTSSSEYKIYIDGLLYATVPTASTGIMTIARAFMAQNYNGSISQVSNAGATSGGECSGLTATEVLQHHNALVELDDTIIKGGRVPKPLSGLLYEYPGAAAAYSLRALGTYRDGFELNVIRVRRTNGLLPAEQDFTAAQITDGTLLAFTGSGDGFVSAWYDQSGNKAHATQNTTNRQPRIVLNGALVLDSSGVNPTLEFHIGNVGRVLNAPLVSAQPLTLFNLRRYRAGGTTPSRVAIGYAGGGNSYADSNISGSFRTYYGSYVIQGANNTDRGIFYSLANGASTAVSLNGGSEVIGNAGTAGASALTIGGAALNFTPRVNEQEVIIYASNQSSNKSGILTNINTHYTIY